MLFLHEGQHVIEVLRGPENVSRMSSSVVKQPTEQPRVAQKVSVHLQDNFYFVSM